MRISICIPTYNRQTEIVDLLDSIVKQTGYKCELEIIISDNASTDNTADVVASYRDKIPLLVYERSAENLGADRNFLKVIELASGDYCWLMGSDDRLEPGGVAAVEQSFAAHPGLAGLSVNRAAYPYAMTERIAERPVAGGKVPHDVVIENADYIFSVLGEYFGYLSGQIVRRSLWNEVVSADDVTRYFNAYVHVYVIGRMIQRCPKWLYVSQRCVGWRAGNDSFLSEGEFKRMSIDVLGYAHISRGLFGPNSRTYHDVNRTVASVHVRYAVMGAKLNDAPFSFYRQAIPLLMRSYWQYPVFWMRTVPVLLAPSRLMRIVRWGYRHTFKRLQARHTTK
ncbi:glycosyltransferase family 2 protein [Sphingomonas cynarae]|uniref:Glycosyltransferase family 2 protein n=1 Tax=Sphingomonas cynarae TaxID=930197 RepID=A0ABP7ESA4_9SPHN